MSAGSGKRAMASWFLDENHVVIPIIKHRVCVDYFIHNVAWILSLVTFLWGVLATLLGAGASPYFFAIAALSLCAIPWLWYGEYAMTNRLAGHTYIYLCGLWFYILGLIWTGAAGYVNIRAGTEFVEENWYELQAQVLIPFTTMLDQKGNVSGNGTTLFYLCLFTGLVHLHSLGEAWKALGGLMRLVQLKFSVQLMQDIPIFILAAASASYATYASTIAAFAVDGTLAVVLWQAAVALLVIVAVIGVWWARSLWGITFSSHAVAVIFYGPLSFLLFVTSLVLEAKANNVENWVESKWYSTLQYLVPPPFAAKAWDKYFVASYTPMKEAAMTGILLSVLLMAATLMQARMAAVLMSVGPELYVSRTRVDALQAEVSAKLAAATRAFPAFADELASAPFASDSGANTPVGGVAAASAAGGVKIVDWSAKSNASSKAAPFLASNGPGSPGRGGSGKGAGGDRFAFSQSSDPGTPLRAAVGGYGALDDGGEDGSRGSSRGGGSRASYSAVSTGGDLASSSYQDVPSSQQPPVSARGAAGAGEAAYAGVPAVQLPAVFLSDAGAGGHHAHSMASRMAALQQYRFLLSLYEKQLSDMEKRVTWPSCGTFFRGLSYGLRQASQAHRLCFIFAGILLIVALGGIGGGLTPLGTAAKCGVLAGGAATRSYTTSFQVEAGTPRDLYGHIYLSHDYPFGSVEFEVDHVPVFPEPRSGNASLTITAFAADEDDLLSLNDLINAVNVTDFVPFFSDDDVGGNQYVTVSFKAPPDALSKCLGIRIRFTGLVGLLFLTARTTSAVINISGNVHDLDDNAGARVALQGIDAQSDTGPIIVNNGYVDRFLLDPVAGFSPSTVIRSNSGDVWFNLLSSPGISVETGGSIFADTLGSFSPSSCTGICGDIVLTTHGYGKISMTKEFGAYNAYLTTEHGDIVGVNTAQIIGKEMRMTSVDGNVVLSSFLMASGNETYVTTRGKVNVAAMFVNRLLLTVPGDADVSIVEIFYGAINPGALINPPLPDGTNYSDPLTRIHTEEGDITILGLSSNPLGASFADLGSVDLYSDSGKIKVEIGGGGINAPYRVGSDKGEAIVEIDGLSAPLQGQIGKTTGNNNSILVFSDKGNVQLSLLPSSL